MARKEYDRAIVDANEAIGLDPLTPWHTQIVVVDTGRQMRLRSQAIEDADEAIRLPDPEEAIAYLNRTVAAYGGKRDYANVIADATRTIKLDAECETAYFNRGKALRNARESR